MAIKDYFMVFSDNQEIIQNAAANEDSTNIIDLGTGVDVNGNVQYPEIGETGRLWLNVRVSEPLTGAGATCDLTVSLITDTLVGFGSPTPLASWTVRVGTGLPAGTALVRTPIPTGCERYLKLNYAIANANLTDGNVDAWIGMDSETPR